MLPALFLVFALQSPPRAADLLREAEASIQAEQFSTAEPLLQRAVRLAPSNAAALYRLGYTEYRLRKLAPARAHFQAVVRLAPPALNARYFLGRIAMLENNAKEAAAWLEPVAASGESIYDADSQLAAAYAALGAAPKAIAALQRAIARAPWDGALYYRLGQLRQKAGDAELAKEAFDTATRLNAASREDVETLMRTAALLGEGKPREALALGANIQERPDTLVALGVLYGNAALPAEALRLFERAEALDQTSFQARFNHGLALLRAGRASDALAPLTAALELLPQSQEAAMTLGLAAVMCRRYEGAIAPLEMARQRDPANPKLAALLATAYLRTGDAKSALPVLKQASESTSDPAPLLLLVEALNATEATTEALDAARLAQRRFPAIPQTHMAAAQQLVRLGRYQEARPAFEQTLKLSPGQPEAELGLADALQKAGQHQAALAHYRAAGAQLAASLGLARSLIALRQLDEARAVLEAELGRNRQDAALHQELSRVYARLGLGDLAAEQTRLAEQLRAR